MARLVTLAIFGASSIASAQPSDKALATELFARGRSLMADERYAEACPLLAESQRLDPGGGTLLNLAICHELEGKTATAWSELHEALGLARRDRRDDRIELALEHMKALEPRLSRLRIRVSAEARSLVIRLDDRDVALSALAIAFPIDPGSHRVEASASGYEPWSTAVTIGPEADSREVTVPTLEPLAAAPGPDDEGEPGGPAPEPPSIKGDKPWTAGLAIGGIMLGLSSVAVATGSYFGARAIDKRSESDDLCPETLGCSEEGVARNEEAKTFADVSTVLFVSSAAALGLGIYLVVTSRGSEPAAAAGPPALVRW